MIFVCLRSVLCHVPFHDVVYKCFRFQNDIALIELDRVVEENDYVSPICLPLPSFLPSPPLPGRQLEVAGWGAVDQFARR